jgi:hypothetical protein
MNVSVNVIKENEDGSADCLVRFDKEGMELMVQWGLIAMLKEAIKNQEYNPQVEKVSERKSKTSKRKVQK